MSLSVYLTIDSVIQKQSGSGIFVREDGQTKEISRKEWNLKHPGQEPIVGQFDNETNEVFSANITHNLGTMAKAAGIYIHLWRPEELNITKAAQLIDPLLKGLNRLRSDPNLYKAFNPTNGWGNYEGFVSFVSKYLEACQKYPEANVNVSR